MKEKVGVGACQAVTKRTMSGFKMVATDLDGTFMLDTKTPPWVQKPSERNIAAVRELLNRGVYFVPLSGRQIPCMAPLLRGVMPNVHQHPQSYIGGYNGGVFVGPEEDGLRPILRQESFAPDAVKQAIEYVAKEGLLVKIFHEMPDGELGVSWCGDFDYSVEQAEFFAACGEFPYTPDSSIAVRCLDEKFRDFYRNVPYVIDPLQGYDAEAIAALNPLKMVVMTNEQDMHIAAISDGMNGPLPFDLVRGNFWYEYMPSGVNKSSGLSWLANHLGFTMDECVAFGDSSNDFEMLRDAGLGVCMDNGRDEVKAVSAKVSQYSNDEDGVGREIEILLEQGAFD